MRIEIMWDAKLFQDDEMGDVVEDTVMQRKGEFNLQEEMDYFWIVVLLGKLKVFV